MQKPPETLHISFVKRRKKDPSVFPKEIIQFNLVNANWAFIFQTAKS